MAAERKPHHTTVEEWRKLAQDSHDVKYEYVDGQAYAMSGGSRTHGRIGSNAVRAIEDALAAKGSPCNVYNSDVATRLSPTRYTYPDVSVTCDEQDEPTPDQTEIVAPRVIVEVLSDSTEAYDRGQKFGLYRACPTVQEYVLVATKYQSVEIFRRTEKGWSIYHEYKPGDELELMSLDVSFPIGALYRNSGVPVAVNTPEGEA